MVGGGGGVSWEFTGLRKIRSDFTGLSPKSAAGKFLPAFMFFFGPQRQKMSRYDVLERSKVKNMTLY